MRMAACWGEGLSGENEGLARAGHRPVARRGAALCCTVGQMWRCDAAYRVAACDLAGAETVVASADNRIGVSVGRAV